MSKRWGTPTWLFLHTIVEKIYNDECYKKMSNDVVNIIVLIFKNLPCPLCRNHAVSYIKKYNIYNVKTKDGMITYLFTFHNWVNKRVGNGIKQKSILDLYKRANTVNICKYFIQEFFKSNALAKDFFQWKKDSLKSEINNFLAKNKLYIKP